MKITSTVESAITVADVVAPARLYHGHFGFETMLQDPRGCPPNRTPLSGFAPGHWSGRSASFRTPGNRNVEIATPSVRANY